MVGRSRCVGLRAAGVNALAMLLATTWSLNAAGGVPSHIWDLTVAFRRLGIDARPYSTDDHAPNPPISRRLSRRAMAMLDWDIQRLFEMQSDLRAADQTVGTLIRNMRPQLVHAHDVLVASAASQHGLPLVLTVHGPLSRELQMYGNRRIRRTVEFARMIEAKAFADAQEIIAVDTEQRDIIVEDFGVSPGKVHVIFNAVDTSVWTPGETRETETGTPILLVPRRLVPKNGVGTLIDAVGRLKSLGGPPVELWIAGDGPERSKIEGRVRDLKLEGQVRFFGSVPRLYLLALLRRSQFVAIPSIPTAGVIEATSIAALEAMAVGRVVLASHIGGLAEVIEDERTGFLCPAGDVDAWASKVSRVLTADVAELRAIGARARAYAEESHGSEQWARSVLRVYAKALGKEGVNLSVSAED